MTKRIVSVSGGKDSTALYLWAIEQWGKDGFLSVFADTGHEHPVTYNYLRNLPAMANGPEIAWVKANFTDKVRAKGIEPQNSPFIDMWLWKGRAPSARAQFCTEHLKLRPIQAWLEGWRKDSDIVEMYVGIRAAESERRSKMPPQEWSDMYECDVFRPLLTWTEEEVWAMLSKHNVPPNPLYQHGSARVGCYPCIHSRKSELASMPDWAWEKLAHWEKLAGRTWFSFGDIPLTNDQKLELKKAQGNDTLTAELKDRFSPRVMEVREWTKTSRGGKQFDMFAADSADVPTCMSTWGVCE